MNLPTLPKRQVMPPRGPRGAGAPGAPEGPVLGCLPVVRGKGTRWEGHGAWALAQTPMCTAPLAPILPHSLSLITPAHTLPTGTATEVSVFGRNRGLGVRVGLDSACGVQAQSHTPPALRLALHWVPGTNLSRTSWAHGEGCHVQGLGRSLLLFSRSVVSSSLPPHGLQHARLPCPSLSTGVQPSLCPLKR